MVERCATVRGELVVMVVLRSSPPCLQSILERLHGYSGERSIPHTVQYRPGAAVRMQLVREIYQQRLKDLHDPICQRNQTPSYMFERSRLDLGRCKSHLRQALAVEPLP